MENYSPTFALDRLHDHAQQVTTERQECQGGDA